MLTKARLTRKRRIRGSLSGTGDRPRLSVYRSNRYIYAQLINDVEMKTLAAAKGEDPKLVGEEIAKKGLALKKISVVFDRGGFRYHGRVRSLAESARAGGLKF